MDGICPISIDNKIVKLQSPKSASNMYNSILFNKVKRNSPNFKLFIDIHIILYKTVTFSTFICALFNNLNKLHSPEHGIMCEA